MTKIADHSLHILAGTLLALSLRSPLAASGDAPKGFRDRVWGSQSTLGLKLHARNSNKISTYTLPADQRPQPIFGVPIREEIYSYSDGRMFNGIAYFSGQDSLLTLRDALINAYGKPDVANDEQQLWRWQWPRNSVQIILHKGSLSYTNNSY